MVTLEFIFDELDLFRYSWFLANIYLSKVSNLSCSFTKNTLSYTQLTFTCSKSAIEIPRQFVKYHTRKRREICSKLTVKTAASVTSFWFRYCCLRKDFTHCSCVLIDFEQVHAGWGQCLVIVFNEIIGFSIEEISFKQKNILRSWHQT